MEDVVVVDIVVVVVVVDVVVVVEEFEVELGDFEDEFSENSFNIVTK